MIYAAIIGGLLGILVVSGCLYHLFRREGGRRAVNLQRRAAVEALSRVLR